MITDQCLCLLRGRKIFVGQQEREEGGFRMPRGRTLLLVHGHRPAGSLDLSGRGLLWPGGLQGCDGSVHTQTDWLSLTWLLSLTFELIKIRACRCDQLSKELSLTLPAALFWNKMSRTLVHCSIGVCVTAASYPSHVYLHQWKIMRLQCSQVVPTLLELDRLEL